MAKKSTQKDDKTKEKEVKTSAKKSAANKTSTKKTSSKEKEVKTSTKKPAANKTSTKKTSSKEKEVKISEKKPAAKKNSAKKSEKINEPIEYSESNPVPRDPKVRYSDKDLEFFRGVIQQAKDEAIDELNMLKEKLDDLTNYDFAEESMIYSMHMAEQGSEAQEKEKTYAQIQRINEYLKKLDEAIIRINEKTYGICRVCSCLIAKERLIAVPVTTLSASYKIHKKCPTDGIDRIEARR